MNTTDKNNGFLTTREKCLLSLLLGKPLRQEDMEILLPEADIEQEGINFLFMLSRVGYMQGWELFPSAVVPRLKGIHRHAQVQNMIGVPWLMECIRILRRAGVPVMLIKGLALRFYYAPGIPRIMGDYDIAVPEDMYEQAMEVLQGNSNVSKGTTRPYHGEIVGDKKILEIHRWIFKHHGDEDTDLWSRAVRFGLYGEEVCVPCPEDMLIHQLDNRCRDMMIFADFPERRINWLYDCKRILETSGMKPDLSALAVRAREFNVTYSTRYMLLLFADTFPDLLSAAEVEQAFPSTPGYEKWFESGLACRRIREKFAFQRAMTPAYILRMFRWKHAFYRHQRYETPYRNFLEFLRKDLQINGPTDVFSKYRSRWRWFADTSK